MKTFEVSARSIEDAISQGLEHLGVSISDVTVDILEEGSKGLFGLFGSKQAKVRLTLNEEEPAPAKPAMMAAPEAKAKPQPAPKKPAQQPAPKAESQPKPQDKPKPESKPKAEKPAAPKAESKPVEKKAPVAPQQPAEPREIVPAAQADRGTAAGRAQEFLQQLTSLMSVPVSVAVRTDDEGNVRVDMMGDAQGILIGRRGETLDALQYLTSLQVNKGREEYTRVTLDSENYRAKREEALIRLANRMANRAQKTGRKVSMEPMNPYERRILHSALQDNPHVTTHSEGEEPNRHVVITLK